LDECRHSRALPQKRPAGECSVAWTIEAEAVVRIPAAESSEAGAIARHACRDAGLTVALDDGRVDPPALTITVSPGDRPFEEALNALDDDADEEW
jgi:hypothetical protein